MNVQALNLTTDLSTRMQHASLTRCQQETEIAIQSMTLKGPFRLNAQMVARRIVEAGGKLWPIASIRRAIRELAKLGRVLLGPMGDDNRRPVAMKLRTAQPPAQDAPRGGQDEPQDEDEDEAPPSRTVPRRESTGRSGGSARHDHPPDHPVRTQERENKTQTKTPPYPPKTAPSRPSGAREGFSIKIREAMAKRGLPHTAPSIDRALDDIGRTYGDEDSRILARAVLLCVQRDDFEGLKCPAATLPAKVGEWLREARRQLSHRLAA